MADWWGTSGREDRVPARREGDGAECRFYPHNNYGMIFLNCVVSQEEQTYILSRLLQLLFTVWQQSQRNTWKLYERRWSNP